MSRRAVGAPATFERSGPWPALPWVVPLVAVLLSRLQVIDLASQLRAGQIMWDSWAVLRTDVFTYTIPGSPWLNQQWGAQLVFSAWFDVTGWRGLIALQAVIVACCFGATYRSGLASGASAVVSACAGSLGFVVAAAVPGAIALRPQLLALPLFMAAVWIIRHRSSATSRLLLLAPIGVLWANVHGSFVLLSALLGIAFVADLVSRRGTAVWTGALLAVSLITPAISPWGLGTYRYIWELVRSPIIREVITEWRPLWTRVTAFGVFVAVGAVAVVLVARHAHRRPSFEEAATLLLFTMLAVASQRNVLWWAVAVPPVVCALLAGWRPGGAWSRSATRVALACLAALLVVGAWRVATTSLDELRTEAPPGITAWLTAHPATGRVFAEWWGWWFEYAIPEEPMFLDARVEVFPPGVWADYGAIVDVEDGWQEVVARWGIDTIVLARGHHPGLEDALRADGSWELAYEDADGFVFTRR